MRVLHVGKFFPPHPGGIERTCADLAAAAAERGIATAVIAHAEPGTRHSTEMRAGGCDVVLAGCLGRWLYAPVSPMFPALLRRTIKRFRPDLLHLHVPNTSAFSALLLPSARRLPWVVHWHADIPVASRRRALRAAYALYRPWEQALLRRASAVIATSQAYLDSSAALAPWRAKAQVIPLGIPALSADVKNAANHTNIQWPTSGPRVLAVGRLSYFKGFDVLLRALARMPDAGLVLIGEGECRTGLERLAGELGIAARVRFAGRVDQDDAGAATLAAAYATADVFCLPSTERAESFGLVLLEAMRTSLPIVASAVAGSGIGFVLADGAAGLLVPPGDAAALADAMGTLTGDPALRRRLGDAGHQRWRAEFTLDASAERVLALHRQVLAARRRP